MESRPSKEDEKKKGSVFHVEAPECAEEQARKQPYGQGTESSSVWLGHSLRRPKKSRKQGLDTDNLHATLRSLNFTEVNGKLQKWFRKGADDQIADIWKID